MSAQPGDASMQASSIEGADARAGEALKAAGPQPESPIHEAKQRIVGDAREAVAGAAAEGKTAAAAFFGDLSQALNEAGAKLDERGRGQCAHLATAAGDALRRFGDDVAQRDLGELLGGVERFARQRPAAFVGVMFVAGFGAARFLRTSGAAEADMRRDSPVARSQAGGWGVPA